MRSRGSLCRSIEKVDVGGRTLSWGGTALRLPPPQLLSLGCVPAPVEWGPGAWALLVAGTFHTEAPGTHLP